MKILYWDGTGLCLFAKRLEKCRFVWPPIIDECLQLTQLTPALLDALRHKFAPHLLKWTDYLRQRGVYTKSPDAALTAKICAELHPNEEMHSLHDGMTSQFEIMRRTHDFAISPHCHPVRELLIALFPITPDDSLADYGTDLLAVKTAAHRQ